MNGKSDSEFGKNLSEEQMSSIALSEAKHWSNALMDAEWRGRKDRDAAVRYRVSKKTGIPESYLYRLQYKTAEMKDVAGSVYRSLMLAYDELCKRNNAVADRYKAEIRKLDESDQKSA